MNRFMRNIYIGQDVIIGFGTMRDWQEWKKDVLDRPGLMFCVRGSGCISFSDSKTMIRPGDMAYYDTRVRHEFHANRDWTFYFSHFPESMTERWKNIPCNTNVAGLKTVHFEKNDFARINMELKEATFLFLLKPFEWEPLLYGILETVFARFFQKFQKGTAEIAEAEQFQPAIRNLSVFRKSCNIEGLAKLCGMSRTDFFRKFRAVYGCTPGEYRSALLISQAKILLDSTDFRVKEIAEQLQFEDCYYFSNFFHSCTGMSPSEWRMKKKKNVLV